VNTDALRIALVRKDYSPSRGGAENYTAMLARALRDMGHEVHIFARAFETDELDSVRLHAVPAPGIHSSLRNYTFAANVEKILRPQSGRYDIVCGLSKIWYQDVYRISDPIYRHWLAVHKMSVIDNIVGFLNPRHRIPLIMERKIFDPRNYRRIIAISKLDEELARKYYKVPSSRIRVIYNGVDHTRFNPALREKFRRAVREKYGIADEKVVFLFAAMDWKRKGLVYALEAVQLLDESQRNRAVLLVVGRGDRNEYERIARRLGVAESVVWEGPVRDIEQYYGAADAFVFPTLYDPFANVHLEALATGLPVITTRMAGGAEIIADGENGFIVPSGDDVRALSAAMRALLGDGLRSAMSAKAAVSVRGFTVERNARETVALYGEILDEKRRDAGSVWRRRG
jgi:UDP-glucose:(heptosyl)LPS alpha-1,3-glucosyltransferase